MITTAFWQTLLEPDHLQMLLAGCRAALYIIIGFIIARLASTSFVRFYHKRSKYNHSNIIKKSIFYIIFILFFISALRELGFDMRVLLGATGLLTVAIGFASQTSASNLISGLFLVGERAFNIGDIIEINNITGEVLSIDFFSVKIKQNNNTVVRVPNEMIIKTQLVNLSYFPTRRYETIFSVPVITEISNLRTLILEMLKKEPLCLQNPAPIIIVKELADSSVKIQLYAWAKQSEFTQLSNIINENLLNLLHKNQITICDSTMTIKLLK